MSQTDNLAASHFQNHVSFDTFASGEPTDKNTNAFTLNVKHKGYQFKRRSRTFMVGVGENEYSDIALRWMLEELVDDGDEIICVRVIDRDSKVVSDRNVEKRQYQTEAKELLQRIQVRNDDNRAIGIVLEFVAGKLHATFQRMIQLYEPAMLIVGTKGRNLGGLQGLMTNRNSFSKWCLQYSPIPVVVVRPTSKRIKKKKKRDTDPTRQDYRRILHESGFVGHEAEASSLGSVWEISNDPEVEANAVAAALGLSAGFDLPLKPSNLEDNINLDRIESVGSDVTNISRDFSSSNISSCPGLDLNLENISPTAIPRKICTGEEVCSKATQSSFTIDLEVARLEQKVKWGRVESGKNGLTSISQDSLSPETSSSLRSASDTSKSSLDTQNAYTHEYSNDEDSNTDGDEFEVIPGKFLLKDPECALVQEVTPGELELDEYLNVREITFLAAQIARNLSIDECFLKADRHELNNIQ